MPRLRVAYDANIYRSFGWKRFPRIVEAERARGIQGTALYAVVEELAAHLATASDPDFGSSRSAIGRLARHCAAYNAGHHTIEFVADAGQQVEATVFGRVSPNRDLPEATNDFAWLVGSIAEADPTSDLSFLRSATEFLAAHVRAVRTAFARRVGEMRARVIQQLGLDETRFAEAMRTPQNVAAIGRTFHSEEAMSGAARYLLRQLAYDAAPSPNSDEEDRLTTIIRTAFPTPLRMFNEIMRRAVATQWSIDTRTSIAYDFRIAFVVSDEARIAGLPLWLVTDDEEFHAAAQAVELSARIIRSTDYLKLLDADISELIARIDAGH